MTIRLLPFRLVLAILLVNCISSVCQGASISSGSSTQSIRANSTGELWQYGPTRFFRTLTNFLQKNTVQANDLVTSNEINPNVIKLEQLIDTNVYEMIPMKNSQKHDAWAVLSNYLRSVRKPTIPVDIDRSLLEASSEKPSDLQPAINTLNKLSEPTKQFITDVCRFLRVAYQNRGDVKLDSTAFGTFLHKSLTSTAQPQPGFFDKVRNLFKAPIKPLIAASNALYDSLSTQFGVRINFKNGQFYIVKVFGNRNIESCWDDLIVQNFVKKTEKFMIENCIEKQGFLREEGNKAIMKKIQEKIDTGSLDFLIEVNCVPIIGPLFKRFLQSFVDPILPDNIAEIMRVTPKTQVGSRLREVLDKFNKLPLARRYIIAVVLRLSKAMYEKSDKNNWNEEGALAKVVDPCLRKPDVNNVKAIEIAKTNNYPMLTRMIERWNTEIYFDEKEQIFKISTVSI